MSATDQPQDGPLLVTNRHAPVVPADRRPMDHKTQPKQKSKGRIPQRQGNGYYADHEYGDRLRGVTTIIEGGVPKKALVFWAAATCTECAVDNLPLLVQASRFPDRLAELITWIKRAHTRKKDERAEVGSAVHKIVEARLLGTAPPASVEVGGEEWALDGPELAPYIANFHRFETEWAPRWTASEMVVANPEHGYAGTLDYTIGAEGRIGDELRDRGYQVDPAGDLMGDTKTGGTWDRITSQGHVHGVYPEAGLQMSAYRRAKVCWLRDGTKVAMPATAETGVVLHLRPEGYRLYPVRCGDLEYSYFRHAQMVDEWSSRIASARADDPVIGTALVPPAAAEQVA